MWFVDLISDAERAFRCERCGDVFDLRDQKPPPPPERKPAAFDRVEALAAEQRRRDADRATRATRIEDELAELKKRLGR